MNKEKTYALYKGDELLGVGTKKELAELLNIKIETLSFYYTPAYKKRTSPDRGRRLVLIE